MSVVSIALVFFFHFTLGLWQKNVPGDGIILGFTRCICFFFFKRPSTNVCNILVGMRAYGAKWRPTLKYHQDKAAIFLCSDLSLWQVCQIATCILFNLPFIIP